MLARTDQPPAGARMFSDRLGRPVLLLPEEAEMDPALGPVADAVVYPVAEGLAGALAELGRWRIPGGWQMNGQGPRRRVLFFTKSSGFEHSVIKRPAPDQLSHAEKILMDLGAQYGFDVTCTKDGSVFDGDLDQYDAIAFYTSGMLTKPKKEETTPPMTEKGKQRLLDAIAAGKGFMGFHAATDSFHTPGKSDENQDNPDPYIAMIGGEFIKHGPQQDAGGRSRREDQGASR